MENINIKRKMEEEKLDALEKKVHLNNLKLNFNNDYTLLIGERRK